MKIFALILGLSALTTTAAQSTNTNYVGKATVVDLSEAGGSDRQRMPCQ